MNANQQTQSGRKAAPPLFTVWTDGPRGVEQIGSGANLQDEIRFAKRHHGATGSRTWIKRERSSSSVLWAAVVYRLERAQVKRAAGGTV